MTNFYFTDRKFNLINIVSTEDTTVLFDVAEDVQSIEESARVFQGTITIDENKQTIENWNKANDMTSVGNYILYKDRQNESVFITIESQDADPVDFTIDIVGHDAGIDLINEVVDPWIPDKAYTIKEYIEKATWDSGFEIGINEAPNLSRKLTGWQSTDDTALKRILAIAQNFDVELDFSFDVSGLDVIHRYINIYRKRGTDDNVTLYVDKELEKIVTKKDIFDLCTSIKAEGGEDEKTKKNVNLKGYKWTDPDGRFTLNDDGILRDTETVQLWSRLLSNENPNPIHHHIQRYMKYETKDKATLLANALRDLKKRSQVAVNYEVDIKEFPSLVKIGDTIKLVDEKRSLYLSARVLTLSYDYVTDKAMATLGDYLIQEGRISTSLADLANELKSRVSDVSGRIDKMGMYAAYANSGDGITDFSRELEDPPQLYIGYSILDSDNPEDFTWSLYRGKDGKDGKGVESGKVEYQAGTSGTNPPTGTWLNNPPAVDPGQYLWSRTTLTYTDGTKTTGYTVGRMGMNGTGGVGIKQVDIEYQSGNSGTTPPTGTWSTTIPSVSANQYLWTRKITTLTNDEKTTEYNVGKMGADGNDAQLLYLTATSENMSFTADDIAKPNQTIIIAAKLQNVEGTATFKATPYIGNAVQPEIALDGSGNSRTLLSSQWTQKEWNLVAITATLGSLTDTLSIIKVKDGDKGPKGDQGEAGKDGTSVMIKGSVDSVSQLPANATAGDGYLINGDLYVYDGQDWKNVGAIKGEDGKSSYLHLAYANSEDGETDFTINNSNRAYMGTYVDQVKADSTDPSKYNWTRVRGYDGYTPIKGTDYFDGKDGQDGKSSYLWIKYSANADGTDMTSDPTGAKYVGYATSQTNLAPTLASAYKWQLVAGKDGIPGEKGADGKTSYLHIRYSNDGGQTFTTNSGETVGAYIGQYTDFTQSDSTNPSTYNWALIKGADGQPGKDGTGIKSTVVRYQASSSGTTHPTGTWTSAVPTVAKGQYLWTRTDWTYTDNSTETGYSVSYIAKDGNNGTNGIAGKDGTGIKSTAITYASSTSGTIAPTSGWTANPPATSAGHYIWTKTVWTYTDGTSETGYSVGKIGEKGEDGTDGKTPYFHIAYANSADGKDGFYVSGGRNLIKNSDAISSWVGEQNITTNNGAFVYIQSPFVPAMYQIEARAIDDSVIGADFGWQWNDQLQGESIKLSKDWQKATALLEYNSPIGLRVIGGLGLIELRFIKAEKGSVATPYSPAPEDVHPTYMGTYTDFTQADSLDPTAYSWTLFKGEDGVAGKDGVGIKSTAITYVGSTNGTAPPSTGWTTSIPTVADGNYLWTKTTWTYTDGTKEDGYSVAKMGAKGATGPTGATGQKGQDGKTYYTHIAYSNSNNGSTGFTLTDPNRSYIGIYVDESSTSSTNPSKYKWTRIEGQKGDQGIAGAKGADGKTPYFHTAWANSADGTTDFSTTDSANKKYIGTYTDFTQNDSTNPSSYKWVQLANAFGGGRNLIIRTDEVDNMMVGPDSTIRPYAGSSVINYDNRIAVVAGEMLTFSQKKAETGDGDDYFRYAFYREDGSAVSRYANDSDWFSQKVPDGAIWLRVSYRKVNQVQVERGEIKSDITPAPEDMASVSDVNSRFTSLAIPIVQSSQPTTKIDGQQWWRTDSLGNVTGYFVYKNGSWVAQTIQQSVLNIVTLNAVTITGSTITGTTISGSEFKSSGEYMPMGMGNVTLQYDTSIKGLYRMNWRVKGSTQSGTTQFDPVAIYSWSGAGVWADLNNEWKWRLDNQGMKVYQGMNGSEYGTKGIKISDENLNQATLDINDLGINEPRDFKSSLVMMAINEFEVYSTSGMNMPQYSRNLRTVQLTGALRNKVDIPGSYDMVLMFTLPVGLRPSRTLNFRQQGSQLRSYLMTIDSNGDVSMSRYGRTDLENCPAGSWLNISCSFHTSEDYYWLN